jgi:acetyltransferase
MLREGRKAALLRGARGRPPADEAVLGAALMAVGDLLVDRPEVAELDVNPLIVSGSQMVAVDALMVVGPGRTVEGEHA